MTRSRGEISSTHVNDLRNGRRDPQKLTVKKIVALADGLDEAATDTFEAAAGELLPGITNAAVAQLLNDYMEIPARERGDAEYAFRQLKRAVEEAKAKRQAAIPK